LDIERIYWRLWRDLRRSMASKGKGINNNINGGRREGNVSISFGWGRLSQQQFLFLFLTFMW
jgi:hypothetical protein